MATLPVPPGLNISRYQGDLNDPDVATAQTVQLMCEQIARAVRDPLVKRAAQDAVNRFRGGPLYVAGGIDPWKNQCAQVESCWWWTKHVLKFQHHDGMIAVYFNEFDQLQLLISPDLLLRMGKPRGDCAIYTMLICALLQCLGIDSEIVTAAVDPSQPDVFSHVYPRAVLSNGRRIVLDASHGSYPGWEVPAEHTLRKQIWDLQASPISDQAPRFKGLHAYQARPVRPILPKRIGLAPGVSLSGYIRGMGRYRRGLGQDYSESSSPTAAPASAGYTPSDITVVAPTSTTPNPFTTALAQSLPGLLAAWTNIGGKVIAPTVQYQGPGGVSYSAPAGSASATVPPSLSSLTSSLTTSSTLPLLLFGGLAIFLVVKAMGSK